MLEITVNVPFSSATAVWTMHTTPVAATTAAAIPLLKDMPFSLVFRTLVAEMVEALLPTVNSDSRPETRRRGRSSKPCAMVD